MIPKRLYIKKAIGIKKGLNKEEIEIDFTKFQQGIVGIVGDTGIGKSVIVEMCTPYLKLITRDGNIQSHFYGRDALKEFEFEFDDKTYLSRFIIDGEKNKVKPYLYEIKDGKEIPLNDKISEYNSVVEKLFGNFDMFVHSVFAPQGEFPIISLSDAELKKLFITLFNLDKYKDEYIPYIKQRYTEIDNEIRVEKLMIEKYDEDIKQEDIIKTNLSVVEKEIIESEKSIDIANKEKDALNKQIKELEQKLEQHRHLIKLKESYKEQKEEIERSINDIERSEKSKIKNIEANLSANKRYRRELQERLNTEEKRFLRYKRIVDNKELIVEKYNRIIFLRKEINKLNKLIEEQQKIKNNIILLKQQKESYEKEIISFQEQNESLRKQTSVIDEVPCANTPMNSQCKLLSNAYKYKDLIEINNTKIKTAEHQVKNISVQIKELISKQNDKYEEELDIYNKELFDLESNKWEKLYDEIDIAQKEMQQYNKLKKELNEKIKLTYESDKEIERRINVIKENIVVRQNELKEKLKDIIKKIDEIEINDPQIMQRDLSELNFKLVNIDGQLKNINLSVIDLKTNMKLYKDALNKIEKIKKEKDELINKIKDYLNTHEAYKIIEKFLKEIPIIEIKSLSNSLKEYTNDLLSGLFDYSLTVDFITEMAKASGKGTKDVFKVLIYNNGDEMLGKNLSGGQKQIVDMAIRMAIETLFYNVSTKKFKTVFMDESDSGLDTERAIKFWEMVEHTHNINDRYYTFIITHRTEIKNNIDQVINLNEWRN